MPLTHAGARGKDFHGKAAPVRPPFRIRFLTLLTVHLETPAVAWASLQAESIPPPGLPAAPTARGQPRLPWAAPPPRGAPHGPRAPRCGQTAAAHGSSGTGTASPSPAGHPRLCPHIHRPYVTATHPPIAAGPDPFSCRHSYKGGWWFCLLCLPLRRVFSLLSPLCLPQTPPSSSTAASPNLITAQTLQNSAPLGLSSPLLDPQDGSPFAHSPIIRLPLST